MKIRELLNGIPSEFSPEILCGDVEGEVFGICNDNRKLKPKDIFICISGEHFDSHTIIPEIISGGASLIVVEREPEACMGDTGVGTSNAEAGKGDMENFMGDAESYVVILKVNDSRAVAPFLAKTFYGNPWDKLVTVGITGTKGKTTTTHMLAAILREDGNLTGTIGSTGAVIPCCDEIESVSGAERFHCEPCEETPGYVVYKLSNTTPDAIELQMYLAMMVAAGCSHAVVEVSSQAHKMHRTDGIIFDYGIWLNIEHGDHIGGGEHADFDEYLECKAAVLNQSRLGFVNVDSPYLDEFLSRVELPKDRVFTFGTSQGADYRCADLNKYYNEEKRTAGLSFDVSAQEAVASALLKVGLPGEFNMYNALAAFTVADKMGIEVDTVNRALSDLRVRGRLDMVLDTGKFRVFIDSAHSGYSTEAHLKSLREYHPNRIICVFGAGGNRDPERRFGMGEASAKYADFSIVTSEHNRFEPFELISADIIEGIHRGEAAVGHAADYVVIPDRREAIEYALDHAENGDIITILGLGSDTYQSENGIKKPHSDAKVVREWARDRL
ncbi:MAG: hypothetical protein J5928_05760 [Firmicutes bacterium]|nr:hypothetical protein [Bacillota bacterium]